jgi:FtsH-binding integral membrane protein
MKPYFANLIYGMLLIILSLWGYFVSDSPSATAFIPTGLGALLLIFTPGMKKENKVIAHLVVILTLLIIIALIMPLIGAINRNDTAAIARVVIMMVWGVVAMIIYIKSFVDARSSKSAV